MGTTMATVSGRDAGTRILSWVLKILAPRLVNLLSHKWLSLGPSERVKIRSHNHPVLEESQYCDWLEINGHSDAESLGVETPISITR